MEFIRLGGKRFLMWSQSGTTFLPGTQSYYKTKIIGNTAYTQAYSQGCGKTALRRLSKNKNLRKTLVAEEGLEPPTRGL